ncbi:MAG: RdgB/HAM1 family non-canonical purine NTP pyrophosphatase [Opitutaceae bacterium]
MSEYSLIIATGNAHKVEEFEQLLSGINFKVSSAKVCGGMPEVDENGGTFAANAQIKAEALRATAPNEAWVLADDSGLEVDALGGAPGVYSARYAGENATDTENVAKLLEALGDLPTEKRTARFRCVLCVIDEFGHITHYDGSCEGHISTAPTGTSGFGYDPVFIPEGHTQSFAELGEIIKGELSHRGKAAQWLKTTLAEL